MLPSAWRYKRFHVWYVISWGCLGVRAGVTAAQVFQVGWAWFWVLAMLAVLAVSVKSRRWYACVLVVMAGFGLGVMRGGAYGDHLALLDDFVGQEIVLSGVISQDPVRKDDAADWQMQLGGLHIDDVDYRGEVYATTRTENNLRRGDRVTIQSKVTEGFGNFRVTMYRAELVKHETHDDVFLTSRDTFGEALRQVVPEPEASLGMGFLVGQKTALPSDLQEQMRIVGLTHIVVASGYNLTILVRFSRRFLAKRSRYLAFVGSLILVAGFVAVSGLSPSMNRAAAVTFLSLLAWYFGRQFHPAQLILYVASASAFLYPVYVWGDLGWMLSFSAFAGVLIVAPVITRLFYKKPEDAPSIVQLLIETTSAQVMTLPIIAVAFGTFSVLALPANLLVAPIIPLAMLATFIAGLAALVAPALWVVALPASIIIAYIVAVVVWLAELPWASVQMTLTLPGVTIWYGVLAAIVGLIWYKKRVDLRAGSIVD